MKYLKLFEIYKSSHLKYTQFILEDIFNELILWDPEISVSDMKTRFPDIHFLEYIKEIFMNRRITFKSVNKEENNPYVSGVVTDVDYFEYKPTEIYIKVKLKDIDEDVLVNGSYPVFVYDYKPGPLQQKLEMLKNAGKFGI